MWTVAGVRAAKACRAWARPISPPSAVTAALLDMFWGLNGRTRSPRLANSRHRPAVSTDLPTSDPQPCSINAAMRRLSEGDRGDVGRWCLGADSNHRHADFQSAALPTELPRPRPLRAGGVSIE